MDDEQNPLVICSELTQLNDTTDFLQDPNLDRMIDLAIKILVKPDVPAAKAIGLINEMQAMSTLFALQAVTYATIKRDKAGTPNNHRKNIYYSAKEALDKLVDCLKYTIRYLN